MVWFSSVPAKPLSEIVLNSFNSEVVTDMNRTVALASSFNGDLSKWDVTNFTDMSLMVYGASSVNGDIGKVTLGGPHCLGSACAKSFVPSPPFSPVGGIVVGLSIVSGKSNIYVINVAPA